MGHSPQVYFIAKINTMLAVVLLSIFGTLCQGGSIRELEDACAQQFDECARMAYEEYSAAFINGDDGRVDWLERISCNYITSGVEDCSNGLIGDCATEEEVNQMKNEHIEVMLDKLQQVTNNWDSDKCPSVKSYHERICQQLNKDFRNCTQRVEEEYKAQLSLGKNGQLNWRSRETCNYMTEATEDCGKILTAPCHNEVDIENRLKEVIDNILRNLKVSPEEYDTDLCPATKFYVEKIIVENTLDEYSEDESDDKDEITNNEINDDQVDEDQFDDYKTSAVKMFYLIFDSLMSTMNNIFVGNVLTQVPANSTLFNNTKIHQLKEIFQFLKKSKALKQ